MLFFLLLVFARVAEVSPKVLRFAFWGHSGLLLVETPQNRPAFSFRPEYIATVS